MEWQSFMHFKVLTSVMFAVLLHLNGAKCNLGKVKLKTMLASGLLP